jgi:hypothetical protein
MPYGKNKYKIWFYDKYNEDDFGTKALLKSFNNERIQNLNKICNALYNRDYNKERDKNNFFFLRYSADRPSIFNRTWYETKDKCIFSLNNNDLFAFTIK